VIDPMPDLPDEPPVNAVRLPTRSRNALAGQGRALSAHRTKESYAGYAKRTAPRILSATRKRHAHWLANQAATSIQNGQENAIQNEKTENAKIA
jgi:hypothetical protein